MLRSKDPSRLDRSHRSLTALLVGAGATMIALTSFALAMAYVATSRAALDNQSTVLFTILCSSCATIFVLSVLHSELRLLYASFDKKESEALVEARTDLLTGLGNRKALLESLEDLNQTKLKSEGQSFLAILDLDQFKNVNDTLGHEAGDELLMAVAERLRENLKNGEAFRLGGDEFAVILTCYDQRVAESNLRNLRAILVGTYSIIDTCATIGCSFGFTRISPGILPSVAMRRADMAMYKAKQGRHMIAEFDDEMMADVKRRSALNMSLRQALAGDQSISTKFQPVFTPDRQLVGLEGLFRWHDAEYGNVAPEEAISIAKQGQLLDQITFFVAEQGCETLALSPDLHLSLNVEASQLFDTGFAECLESLLASKGIRNSRVQLEISEADFVKSKKRMTPILVALAESGFRIAVDDFGSSNSSLSHLAQLGVTSVKFDHSVIRNAREARNIAIVQAKVSLAKSLGITVTCKHVSDEEDEAVAIQSGADLIQGYYYGRPDKIEVFASHLDDQVLKPSVSVAGYGA